jgi:hypothetical protein
VIARLTVAEVAAATRRHPVTVRRALEAGVLHGAQAVKGGRWSVQPECVEAWVDAVPCQHRTNVVLLRSAS